MNTEQRIKRIHVTQVRAGMYVVGEDDDELTDAEINADWDASEQDWQHVVHASHKADVSQLTLAMYNGDRHVTPWSDGFVWALWQGDGPVEQDPED